ncbi:IS30 family transposase, partial [Rhizobium aquaticum]
MKTRYSHLTLADRRQIERWRLMKMSATEIAERLGRHRSTVFRELRRNRHHDVEIPELTGYWCVLAQKLALGRRFRHRKLVRYSELRQRIVVCLKAGWSPEQIAGRMRFEGALP